MGGPNKFVINEKKQIPITEAKKPELEKKKTPEKTKDMKKEPRASSKDRGGYPGMSGRNLYFQQIRSEINMSESNKYKGLPEY